MPQQHLHRDGRDQPNERCADAVVNPGAEAHVGLVAVDLERLRVAEDGRVVVGRPHVRAARGSAAGCEMPVPMMNVVER
jgi:hypothetical protein